jgi:predicted nucleic acid-binding protein
VSPRHHLDADVVLRFLRNDDPKQSAAAARLFASAKAGRIELALSAVTVAEVFYVLARVYKHTKAGAATLLLPLVQTDIVRVGDRARVLDALRRVVEAKVDFGGAYLAATAAEAGDTVASFDEDLRSFADVTTVVPS